MNKVVEKAESIVGKNVESLGNINEILSVKKAQTIISDDSHPLNSVLTERQSRRIQGRYLSIKCHSSRYAKTFIPSVIRTLNKRHERS